MKKNISTLILIVCIISIFTLSFIPNLPIKGFDKIAHFIGFFILTIVLLITFSSYNLKNKKITAFLISILTIIIIEFIQIPIPGRGFEIQDMLAGALGTIAALILKWKS